MPAHKKNSLLTKLEEVREELHRLSLLYNFDFQKEEVLHKSEELDQLIVDFSILINKTRNRKRQRGN